MASFLKLPTPSGTVVINVDHIQYFTKAEKGSTRIEYADETNEIVNLDVTIVSDLITLAGHNVVSPSNLVANHMELGYSKEEARAKVYGEE